MFEFRRISHSLFIIVSLFALNCCNVFSSEPSEKAVLDSYQNQIMAIALETAKMKQDISKLPESTYNPFTLTRSEHQKNIQRKISELKNYLGYNQRIQIRERVEKSKVLITKMERKLIDLEQKMFEAPESVPLWKDAFVDTREECEKNIQETRNKIRQLQDIIKQDCILLAQLMQLKGFGSDEEKLDLLIEGIGNHDLDSLKTSFENMLTLNKYLEERMLAEKKNHSLGVTYYHVHVTILESYLELTQDFILKIQKEHFLTLDNAEKKVLSLIKQAYNKMEMNSSEYQVYEKNVNSLKTAGRAIKYARKMLIHQKEWAEKHVLKMQKKLFAAQHTLSTAMVVSDMVAMIKSNIRDFEDLSRLTPPDMILFEGEEGLAEALLQLQSLNKPK